ncbi:LLM class F420-dependent oxidoreductase, partial [Kibdelosporangium lantanae]
VAESIPCGPDVEPIAEQVKQYADAGFTDLALVQIGGGHQDGFLDFAEHTLLPALR